MPPVRSVVFVTYHFPPEVGGIQTRIAKYVEKLAKRGVRVRVLIVGRQSIAQIVPPSVRLVACPGGIRALLKSLTLVARNMVDSRADVVHVFTGSSTMIGVCAVVFARVLGARPVVSFFGREDFDFRNFLSKALLLTSVNLACSIDVNSGATASLLPERLKRKVHLLLGAAEVPLKPLELDDLGPPTVLFVGRLVARKGVDDLLRAFAILRPRFPEARLSVVGEGPEMERLIRLASELGVSRYLSFKGTLKGAALDQEYEHCTVCVLPSKDVPSDPANEGLGLTLIEASMHGKPLIGTVHGGIPEIVKPGVNGLLVPPGDPGSLADAIGRVLSDPAAARNMGSFALQEAMARFSWDKATDLLLESYVP